MEQTEIDAFIDNQLAKDYVRATLNCEPLVVHKGTN